MKFGDLCWSQYGLHFVEVHLNLNWNLQTIRIDDHLNPLVAYAKAALTTLDSKNYSRTLKANPCQVHHPSVQVKVNTADLYCHAQPFLCQYSTPKILPTNLIDQLLQMNPNLYYHDQKDPQRYTVYVNQTPGIAQF